MYFVSLLCIVHILLACCFLFLQSGIFVYLSHRSMIPSLQTGIRAMGAKMEGGVSGFLGMIVLNSHNYLDWKIKMEDLLIVKECWSLSGNS